MLPPRRPRFDSRPRHVSLGTSALTKKKKKFLIYQEIQMGSGAKSYLRKGFLIYEEMRRYFTIYEEAVSPYIRGKFYFLFISV